MIDALITWAVAAITAASLIGFGWILKTLSIKATPPDDQTLDGMGELPPHRRNYWEPRQ